MNDWRQRLYVEIFKGAACSKSNVQTLCCSERGDLLKLMIATTQPLQHITVLADFIHETIRCVRITIVDEGSNESADILMLVSDDSLEFRLDRLAKEIFLALVIGASDAFYRHSDIVVAPFSCPCTAPLFVPP